MAAVVIMGKEVEVFTFIVSHALAWKVISPTAHTTMPQCPQVMERTSV